MKNKIILVFPPYCNITTPMLAIPSLRIAAPLHKEGYEIKIINGTYNSDYINSALKELDDRVICVGITTMTGPQITASISLAKAVKKARPDMPTVWGGWHPSVLPRQTLESEFVDFVVRGQGEQTFYELIKCMEDGKGYENIHGLSFKINGNIVENQARPLMDINLFPPIPFELENLEKCLLDFGRGSSIHYVSSQGCPFRCSFCVEPVVNKRKWSGLSIDRAIDDIQILVEKYGVRDFVMDDTLFFMSPKRTREFCEKLLEKNLRISYGSANGRIPQLAKYSDELWKLISESGCYSVLVGLETGKQEILELIKKDFKVDDVYKFNDACVKYNISVNYSTMVGFPVKSHSEEFVKSELKDLLELFYKVLSTSHTNTMLLFFYTPYPGSELFQTAIEAGFKPPKTLEEWGRFDLDSIKVPWVSRKHKRWVDSIKFFIVPFYKGRLVNKDPKGILRYPILAALKIFDVLAAFRLKNMIYQFPIEYQLIKTSLKIRELTSKHLRTSKNIHSSESKKINVSL
jgi:radical SAM superfamily enzyme YgiQ (UPF0313 family)